MRALLVGEGAAAALAAPGPVRRWSRFSHSGVVRSSGGIAVLVPPQTPPGPVFALVDEVPRSAEGLAGLDLDRAGRWWGPLPEPGQLERAREVARDAARSAAGGTLVPASRRVAAERALSAGDLAGAVAALGGAGPGLTPAGDDALSGIFFALRALRGVAAEARLARLAAGVATTDLAAAFLCWAARGQALAPAHELLEAAVRGDTGAADRAAVALAAVGHSSGADFAYGLAAGLGMT